MTEIQIPLSKTKIFLLLLGAFAFVVAGIFGILNPQRFTTARYPENLIFIVSIVAVLFFGILFIFIARKIFNGKPGLVINDQGIYDNSNATSIGLIDWQDITGMTTLEIASSKIIMIKTSNPDKYIARAKNVIAKNAMKANHKMYGSPLSIIANSLKIKFADLEKLVAEHIELKEK